MRAKRQRTSSFVTVACPGCGEHREITTRQHRRNIADGRQPLCMLCASQREAVPSDDDLWFWLETYGVVRNHETARQYIDKHGMPVALAALALGVVEGREP